MTEGVATLPQGWTTGQSNDGRTFYINHASKTTAWERPESAAPPPNHFDATTSVPAPANVYPMAGRAASRSPQAVSLSGSSPQVQMGGCVLSMRRIFWVSAGLGWIVWIFSVSSAGDQNWMTNSYGGYGIGAWLNNYCDSVYAKDSLCAAYEAFMATQIIATVTCSVAVIIYTIAFFRPFEAQHGSTKVLGLVGGILMALATFFQMLAFIFAGKWIQEELEGGVVERGPTYGVGVATFVFGCLQATLILLSFWAAGDGPLLTLAQQPVIPKEVDIPAQAFASQRKGTQPVANMPQVPQPGVSMGRGAIAANPPQLSHSNGAPPPYMFPDSGSYSSQPNNAKNRPPPSYHSADSGSTSV